MFPNDTYLSIYADQTGYLHSQLFTGDLKTVKDRFQKRHHRHPDQWPEPVREAICQMVGIYSFNRLTTTWQKVH